MYINYFTFNRADAHNIDTIPSIKENKDLYDLFYDDGFRHYLKSNHDLLTMINNLLSNYLQHLPIAIESIEQVLFVSENNETENKNNLYHNRFVAFRNELYKILSTHGLNKVLPYIIGGFGCVNLSAATKLAQSLLLNKEGKHVLVIFIDKFEDDAKRIMPLVKTNRMAADTISSDVAVAFLLSTQPDGKKSIRINLQAEAAHIHMMSAYYDMVETGNQTKYILETVKGLMDFKRSLHHTFKKPLSQYEHVYTGNYTQNYFKIYNLQFNWPQHKANMDSKAAIGHAQSLDGLYAIFNTNTPIEDGLIFLIGPCMWGAIDFTYLIN